MDLGILNTVIAMVIVLLVLSLLVQSVQMLLKKLLKLKSKQIEDSLKDLFDQAIAGAAPVNQNENNPPANNTAPAPASGGPVSKIGHLARVAIVGSSDTASAGAEHFAQKVLDEFKKIGRVTKYGKPVLDSLSKEDLFKVMAKFESKDFFPDYAERFKEVCNQIIALRTAVEAISSQLQGPASAKLAQIRVVMAPIFNNVEAILDGEQVKPNVLFADLLRLRQLDISGVLNLLDEAQQAVTQERIAAAQAENTQELAVLDGISKELAGIAELIGELSKRFDEAVSPLRRKLEQVEVWFDTVTQSFDERYARHMKTVSIYISIVIVILLNANFFLIYRTLSTNEVQRNLISEAGAGILDKNKPAQPAASPASTAPDATASPTPSLREEVEQSRQAIQSLVDTYEGFGFSPLTGEQFYTFLWSTGGWTAIAKDPYGNHGWLGFRPAKNEKGLIVNDDNIPIPPNCQEKDHKGNAILIDGKAMKCEPAWVGQNAGEWWESRKADVFTVFGWAVMVMLLSVGAPFWQDTLESLFGIKNLLRQKSGTQNIETQSGAGQPKQA
ncbi:MAG TPA: hypothetical protein VJS13_17700 [Pyrinomonadaceae bacterium]|nr:hypothetical protein [Pyrinomonadaceae bacterium]